MRAVEVAVTGYGPEVVPFFGYGFDKGAVGAVAAVDVRDGTFGDVAVAVVDAVHFGLWYAALFQQSGQFRALVGS